MDTVQKNSRTRYSSAGNFQFSNLGEMVRHATHAKLLLLEPHLPNPGCFKGGGEEWDFSCSDSNQMKCFCSFLARSAPLTFQNKIMCCSCRRECGDGAIWLSGCGHEKMPRVRNGYMQTRHSEQKLHSEAQRQIQGAMGGHDRRWLQEVYGTTFWPGKTWSKKYFCACNSILKPSWNRNVWEVTLSQVTQCLLEIKGCLYVFMCKACNYRGARRSVCS